MHAYFDAQDGSPKVVIKIKGTKRKTKEISALLDTGHNGSLSLPLLDLIEVGAKLSSFGPVGLADGSRTNMYFFNITVEIDGKTKEVQASMISNPAITEAIVGLELLSPYVAVINFNKKQIFLKTEEQLKKGF
jgi:predicted aspartyl protease